MIKYCTGDILKAETKAIVIPVNCVGIMGRGLAKQFKEKYSEAYSVYRRRCDDKVLGPGGLIAIGVHRGPPSGGPGPYDNLLAIMLATKNHWRQPSKLEWIIEGMKNLNEYIEKTKLESVALPKVGCGHGGLSWLTVRPIVFAAIGLTKCEVHLYE